MALGVVTGAPQHGRTCFGRPPGRLRREPCLADPGLAAHQPHRRALGGQQDPELVGAAAQRRTRRGAYRGRKHGGGDGRQHRRGRVQGKQMQLLGGRSRAHAQLGVERFAAQVVLAHGLAAQALAQIGVDQHPVGALLGGRGSHGAQRHLGGRLGLAVGEVGLGQGEPYPLAQRGQLLAPGLGPGRIAVLGQQFAGERGECGGQRLGRTPARACSARISA